MIIAQHMLKCKSLNFTPTPDSLDIEVQKAHSQEDEHLKMIATLPLLGKRWRHSPQRSGMKKVK